MVSKEEFKERGKCTFAGVKANKATDATVRKLIFCMHAKKCWDKVNTLEEGKDACLEIHPDWVPEVEGKIEVKNGEVILNE